MGCFLAWAWGRKFLPYLLDELDTGEFPIPMFGLLVAILTGIPLYVCAVGEKSPEIGKPRRVAVRLNRTLKRLKGIDPKPQWEESTDTVTETYNVLEDKDGHLKVTSDSLLPTTRCWRW